ncbi:MAG: division/cell wall cluster transcriptional repressor MraZ [Bacteroidales bacterium]|nr:division/cell wall cluster transcriptional repressor MraZ [Bacteroidales bacterium]
MCIFTGDFQIKIDQKGRFVFPSAFLEQLEDNTLRTFVVKRDLYEKCLTVYTQSGWREKVESIKARLNPFNRQHNSFLREFFKDTAEVELDSNNRLLVPKRLAEDLGLEKDLCVIGLGDRIEVWSTETFEASRPSKDDFAAMAQEFLGTI